MSLGRRAAGLTRPPPEALGSTVSQRPRNFAPSGLAVGLGTLPRSAAEASPWTPVEVFPLTLVPEEPPPQAGLSRGEYLNRWDVVGVRPARSTTPWRRSTGQRGRTRAHMDVQNAHVEYRSAPRFERRGGRALALLKDGVVYGS